MSKLTPPAVALVLGLALVACSGGGGGDPVAGGAQTSTTAAGGTTIPILTAPTAAVAATTTSTVAAAPKANANTAPQSEIQATLAANGVDNASRWAVEVVEYRPYPTSDPSFAKLRQNLAKYNPGPATLEKIVASLSL